MMQLPANKVIVFNAAAGLVTVAALVAVARTTLFAPETPPCGERYLNATMFPLQRGGVMLTAADLQAGLGGRDIGVIDNLAIAKRDGAPSPVAISVKLAKGAASAHSAVAPKGGVSFPWAPRSIQGKANACLSYHVLLPADFEFHRGGALPGITGGETGEDGFQSQFVWRANGKGGVTSRVRTGNETKAAVAERESFALPRGRWVKLEQELVLNAPKKADGVLRVWVDGKLAFERSDMKYRLAGDVAISGVSVEAFYGGEDAVSAAPKDAVVWMTPFELRWQ